jgi:magnesium-transporting ATPase (P-type)
VALTVALAIGVKRMSRRNVLVRRLEAVEGLGSCSVIGSDKTGTLTANQLTVAGGSLGGTPFTVTGAGFAPEGQLEWDGRRLAAADEVRLLRLVRAGALCNEGSLVSEDGRWQWDGDPTDVALLALAHKAGVDPGALREQYPLTNTIPFEPERRYAASFHRSGAGGLTLVKGAPERVLTLCDRMVAPAAPGAEPGAPVAMPLSPEAMPLAPEAVHGWVRELALQGHRVLALAEREDPQPLAPDATPPEPSGLTLIGLVGMTDPPRDGVPAAVAACHRAGIRVVMITGDHLDTAWIIAARVGLVRADGARDGDDAIDGAALERLDDAALRARVGRLRVVARATPAAKLRVVQALQANGEFVAVTGDGVNDAPALRAANIGVAMGKAGTDVAREAADLVITDDNFASIVAGVEEGRVAYENVRKVIYLLVSTGLGEVLAVMLTLAFGLPVPFLPAQLLWLNLVTNGIQDVALAFEPREPGILRRTPRPPSEPIFNRIMIERTVLGALVLAGVGVPYFAWLLEQGMAVPEARGLLLNLFVVFEMFHAGNSRSEQRSLFALNPLANPLLFLGTVAAMGVHVAALYTPFMQAVLGAAAPTLEQWALLVALGATVLVVMELHKFRLWLRRTD